MSSKADRVWEAYRTVVTMNQTTREQNDALYKQAQRDAKEADADES